VVYSLQKLNEKKAGDFSPALLRHVHKPDSVHPKIRCFIIYLRNLPPSSSGQPSNASVHDLATRKVYLSQKITFLLVSSYFTFSPLPVLDEPSAV
jgi:hypothetical protein